MLKLWSKMFSSKNSLLSTPGTLLVTGNECLLSANWLGWIWRSSGTSSHSLLLIFISLASILLPEGKTTVPLFLSLLVPPQVGAIAGHRGAAHLWVELTNSAAARTVVHSNTGGISVHPWLSLATLWSTINVFFLV